MPNEVKLLPCEAYVLGPISECDEFLEDGSLLWQAEVQTMGGYEVVATIYGTEDSARQMAEQAIAAWNTRPTTVVTDEVVERMREALEQIAISPSKDSPFHPAKAASIARAALEAMPTVVTGEQPETLESISAWCDETFGPASPLRMAARANEEMAELIDVASRAETYSEKVLIEAADVLICLARFPGLWAAVERKMSINRSRVWRLTGEGTGYHVPEPPAQPGDA